MNQPSSVLRAAHGNSLSVTMVVDSSMVVSALAGLAVVYILANYIWPSKRSVSPTLSQIRLERLTGL